MDAEALSGKVLGTCTLQQLIGRGGMGAVFLAQQSRPRRQVAIKVLLPMIALQPYQQVAFLERFRRETDAIALLVHPNIVPVHEYSEQDGMAYLVMPYISGGTLRDELEREGKLSLTQAVNYLEQMSAALQFAHERGIIHRDIKPANILLTPEKRLVLTDFGLVKIITEEQSDQTPLSGPGMPMGTPDYMSPEQVLGGEIDARADLYCLGVILYQMVTGVVPFKGEMPMKVAMHHLHTPPPSPRALRPDLPSSAESVILKALAKNPEDRYADTHGFALAFRQALEDAGVVLADVSGNTASVRIVKKDRNMSNRQRSLFDPLWREHQSQQELASLQLPKKEDEMENQPKRELLQKQEGDKSLPYMQSGKEGDKPLPYMQSRNSLLSRNRLRPEHQTNLLSEEQPNSANKPSNLYVPQGREPASSLSPTASGILNPSDKAGLLRSYTPIPGQAQGTAPTVNGQAPTVNGQAPTVNGQAPTVNGQAPTVNGQSPMVNGQAQGQVPTMAPPGIPHLSNNTRQLNPLTPANPMGNWPDSIEAESNPYQPEATSSFNLYNPAPGTTGMLKTQTGALIPVSPPGATGAFMVPTGNEGSGQTGMLKLTQSVKVVRVPLAGQPGQYVTGLLPVISPVKEESKWSEPQADTSLKGRLQKNMRAVILIAVIVVLLLGSVTFLVTHSHSPVTSSRVTGTGPNKAATVTAQASATAQANLLVADPLTSPIHGWPIGQNDTGIYNFVDGAYHIKATSDKNDAVALLPNLSVSDNFVYTISISEINGLDNSTDANKVNKFGLLFRLSQPDDHHLSYYAFLIDPNSAKPTYEFQKYDNSQNQNEPRTTLWTGSIGGEYNLAHNVTNVIKIVATGTHFAFNVNGKDISTKDDTALTSGQIGMIVNLRDTEIAFSNLLLTNH